jgi:predicted PurR-regulated permease PerM
MTSEARNMPRAEPKRHAPPIGRLPLRRREGQSLSLTVLAILAVIYVLHWAQAFFVPVMLAVILSYAFAPAVQWLFRWHVPKALAAAVVLCMVVAGTGWVAYAVSDEAADMLETLPSALRDVRRKLDGNQSSVSAIKNVQEAATELEGVAAAGAGQPDSIRGVTKVQIVDPQRISDWIWNGTFGAAAAAGQLLMVLFLTYFLLASGDIFRRKLLKISGPALSRRKVTAQALDEITTNIQRYVLIQLLLSIVVGIATWLAFLWIGLENAAAWGIAAGIFNTVPYVGPVIVTVGSALAGAVQFGTLSMGAVVGAVSLVITTLEGYLLAPLLTGRAGRLNAVVVFLSVALWGWLWGPWGLILGVPIVMMVKAVCDRIENFRPVGELLGE